MAELKYVDWDGLVYYDGKIKEYIQDRDENYVKMGGMLKFEKLPDPNYYNLNYIYKITDSFTTNSRFDKPGVIYEAGTWVQCVDLHDDASRYRYIIFNEETIGKTADMNPEDYYTKEEVEQKIEDAINSIELDNYYTKSEVDSLIPDDFATKSDIDVIDEHVAAVEESIEEVQIQSDRNKEKIKAIDSELFDIKEKIETIPTKVSDLENDIGYATQKDLDDAIASIPSVDLTDYAKKSDIPDVSKFATEEFVLKKIAEAELADQDVDLSAYYTKSETDAQIAEAVNNIVIPDVSNFATKEELQEAIDSIEHPVIDLSDYVTKEELAAVEEKIPSIDNLATKDELSAVEVELRDAIANIEHPTVDLTGYATEDYVNEAINGIEIPESELFIVDFNTPDYTAAREAYNNGKFLVLTNAAPDVNSYAVMNYVSDKYITFTKFLMSRSTAYGAFNTYYLSSDNTWEVAKEVKLNVVEANTSAENTTELTTIKIGKEVYTLPKTDLSNYYTKADVDALIPEVPTKVSELENDAGYLTQHQDLSEYAKKSDIPSHEDFVTKDALEEVTQDVISLNKSASKQRYEILAVPGLGITYRDDEIRLNTEHIELKQQDVGEGGESNAYYIGIRIYAPENAHSIRQNVTSAPGIQDGKEIVPFTDSDIDAYGRKFSNAWVKCAIYQNGKWTNYGLSSTADKCLGYYYSVEWFDANGNIIENDTIHVVFTNDSCHYSNISDAVSRRFIDVKSSINNIEQNYVTNEHIEKNYTTTEQLEANYVTNTTLETTVENKVTEVIQEKVDTGEIEVKVDSITYGEF